MKVLLVAINSQFVHSSSVPWLLKTACRNVDGLFDVAEFTINDRSDRITSEIILRRPDVLAISCYIWNFELVHKIVPDIKKVLPQLKVILGGPEVEYSEKPWYCDEVLKGDGETSLVKYFGGEPTCSDPFLEDEELQLIVADEICKAGKGKIVYLETVRGCPFKCSYCLAPQTGKVRKLNIDLVKKIIDIYMNSEVRQVKFVDRTFNADKSRAYDILVYIFETYVQAKVQGNNPPENWHFEVAADLFDERMFSLVEQFPEGLVQFEVGVQSLNEKVLADSARKTDVAMVLKNIARLVASNKCMIHADLIAGLPGEDFKSFATGFDLLHRTSPHQLQLGFLKVLKGSTLEASAKELGLVWSENAPFQVLQTREMSWDELRHLTLIEEVLERCWNNGRFVDTVKLLAKGNYFEFYETLARGIEHLLAQPMSAPAMAVELFQLALDLGVNHELAKRTIKIDLLASCFPVKIPDILMDCRFSKDAYSKISRQAAEVFGQSRVHLEALSEREVLVINCDHKDNITGRFKYLIAQIV